jgi:hypothetical protein
MRNTLLQGLRPPLTESAPGAEDPELAALAATVKEAAERVLPEPGDPARRRRLVQWLRT